MTDLEFIISQYVDGDLSDADRLALERRVIDDPGTRALLEEYQRLNASLKQLAALPAVRWDRLSAQVSQAIADVDEREREVCEYIGGMLDDSQRRRFESRLERDEVMQALLADHRRLDNALAALPSMPSVNWPRFSQRVLAVIDRRSTPADALTWSRLRIFRPVALAASLLVAFGLAALVYLHQPLSPAPLPAPARVALKPVVEISGPVAEIAKDPVADIQIGPSKALASDAAIYADDLEGRPARLIMASSAIRQPDAAMLPY